MYKCSIKHSSNSWLVSLLSYFYQWGSYIRLAILALVKLPALPKHLFLIPSLLLLASIFCLGILGIFIPINVYGDQGIYETLPEIISVDTLLASSTVTYLIDKAITVDDGVTLIIASSTSFVVTDLGRIRVLGSLIIGEAVFYESATSSHRRMDLYLDNGSLEMVDVEFHRPLRIHGQSSSINVKDSNFKDLGVYVSDGFLSFQNVQANSIEEIYITNSRADLDNLEIDKGKKIYVSGGSDVVLSGSILKNMKDPFATIAVFENSSLEVKDSVIEDYVGSGIFSEDGDVSVYDSRISRGKIGIDNNIANVSIVDSAITGNSLYGIFARNNDFTVQATGNFWGDISGPYHLDSNVEGLGNAVSNNVEYDPWLSYDPMDCCSSVLFLPGFQASRLYMQDSVLGIDSENRLWEPNRENDGRLLEMDLNGNSLNHVYAKPGDILAEVFEPLPGPNIYKSFLADLDELKNQNLIADWAPVSYDWRLSVDDIVEKGIIHELEYLAKRSRTGRVTIVAHSNGGLVTKALMRKLELAGKGLLVDKIIFVGVPQIGTPKALGSLLHGFKEGIPFVFSAETARWLGQNMPGAYGLLPSARYTEPLITFDSNSVFPWIVQNINMFGSQIDNFSDLGDFLIGGDGRSAPEIDNLTNPNVLNRIILDKSNLLHTNIDGWMPPRGVRLFEIAGTGLDTVSGISYQDRTRYKKIVLGYKPILTTEGDGTVVMSSALAMPEAHNIEEFRIDMRATNKGFGKNRAHADMLEILPLRQLIKSLVLRNPEFLPVSSRSQYFIDKENQSSAQKDPSLKVFINSSSDNSLVNIYDKEGNHTGISTTTGLIENNILGASYQELGSVVYISLPTETVATSDVFISSNKNDSITIEIEQTERTGPQTEPSAETISFKDIEVSTSTVIVLNTIVLEIDDDGDGDIDREIFPDGSPENTEDVDIVIADGGNSGNGGGSRSGGRRRLFATTTVTAGMDDISIYIDDYIDNQPSVVVFKDETVNETDIEFKPELVVSGDLETLNQTASVFEAVSDNSGFWNRLLIRLKTHFTFWFFRFSAN